MPDVSLRFYEELNDFLPPDLRKRSFACSVDATQPVKHLIESLGVPHTEVEVILVNGESVDFDYLVQAGDRISIYPLFEALDVTPLLRLHPRPMRRPRFVADAHLGRLARYLRLLGFDCLFFNDAGDRNLARISVEEGRILLSRDRGLLMHRIITHGCFIHHTEPREQLNEIVRRLQLESLCRPFTRCMECNSLLSRMEKGRIEGELPDNVRQHYNEFWRCDGCGRIYWKGSHYRELKTFVDSLVSPT